MQSEKSSRRIVDASLLRAVVEQFVERRTHPIGDLKQFERLALGLISIVDAETVAEIARPLGVNPETPPAIFAALLDKGGACAELAIEFSPALPRAGALAIAQLGAPALACALARRKDLDREAVDALAQRAEAEVPRTLAANPSARFDASARRALTQAARDDQTLARILLDREDCVIEPDALFLAATRAERTVIILNACRRALASGQIENVRADPGFVQRLERAAVRRDREAMAALLADALECRKAGARGIVSDSGGEALALALTALGVGPEAATRIFLCADPTISYDAGRVRALVALLRSTPPRAAMQIVAAVAGSLRGERETPRRMVRDDFAGGPGWRRATPRLPAESSRKRDQSA